MPTDAETLKWVTVDDFSPGIYDPRGTVLDSRGPSQSAGAQTGAPLGAAQLEHAIVTPATSTSVMVDSSDEGNDGVYTAAITAAGLGKTGLVSGNAAIGLTANDGELFGHAPLTPGTFTDSFYLNFWFNFDDDANGTGGATTYRLFVTPFASPDPPQIICYWVGNAGGKCKLGILRRHDYSATADEVNSGFVTLANGTHMATFIYNADADVYTFLIDGQWFGSADGGGHRALLADPASNTGYLGMGFSPGTGISRLDEAAWGPASTVLLSSDTFDRANGAIGSTDGAGTTDPQAWVAQSGTWVINTNLLQSSVIVGTRSIVTLDLDTGDVHLLYTHTAADGNGQGIIFRFSDTSNYCVLLGDNTQLRLVKVVAGVSSAINATNYGALIAGTVVEVLAFGSQIKVIVDGVEHATVATETFNQSETLHGLSSQGTGQRFNNWFAYGLSPGDFADLFAEASSSFDEYSTAQLAMSPTGYYHFTDAPRIATPGTFRCVCAPGKGLVGAPRLVTNAILTQQFPIVSSLRSGSTTTNVSNRLADISGNGHHGVYTAANFERAPGINPSSGAIADTTALAPTQTSGNPTVATTTFDGDWTVNFWCDDLGTGDASAHTMLYVWNAASSGANGFITISRRNDLAGTNQFQLIIERRWAAGGGNSQTWTQAAVAALAAGYHMLTVKYTIATDVIRILIDGVLIETIAGSGAAGSVLSAPINAVGDWLRGSIGTQWDEVSFHPSVLTDPQVATIFAAATSQGAYQAAVMARSPDSYYTFEEDGTHPSGENRALITATHLVSPILRSSATIQPTPPAVAGEYQDGLFVSFSQFVDPAAGITYANRIDARLYKLWTSPHEIYDLDTGFTLGTLSMTPLLRLDTTPWSAPFWHGVADWAEVITGNGAAGPPNFTQVCFLYNVVQSRQTAPYAAYIMGYPHPNTPAVDSIITVALGGAGNFLTPELLFSHEGRLCDIDSHDGDLFGTNAARRGFNDINYWPIRNTTFGFGLPYILPRPIEENQSGIRVAQSINANELFLVKATGGGAVLSGDMDFPTIRRLPGLHSPGDLYAKPINTPLGVVYAGYGGVFLWSGAESSQLLSPQFDGPFWHPYLGAFSAYTPPANRFGFVGGFGWLHPWILAPSHFLFDTRFNSWWVLDYPADPMPPLFAHGTAQGHIIEVYPEISFEDYTDTTYENASFNSTVADRYDSNLQATAYSWTSQPITPEAFRVAQIREVNVQATATSPSNNATITVTIAALDGTYEQHLITLNGDGRPHTYRIPFAIATETIIVSLDSAAQVSDSPAPIIHSFRVGYELLAEHPMIIS